MGLGWGGVRYAKKHGSKPHQFANTSEEVGIESEDCLYMNIWAPENAKNSPVFVWIYGGAYAMGSCSEAYYDGTNFAKEGIVYVAFNYRLGVLGFYDFTMYDDSFDSNCGVSDQIMALKWVKENIEAFGGDPNNITIAGESAGAASVTNMLAVPKAKGLFNKAIAESPLPGCVTSHNTARLITDIYLKRLGLEASEVHKLKTMELEDIKKAALYVIDDTCSSYPGMYIPGPVLDDLIPRLPWEGIALGSSKGVKLIIGTNHDEGTLFINKNKSMLPGGWKDVERMLRMNKCFDSLPKIHKLYDKFSEEMIQIQEIMKDRTFLVDSIKVADAQSEKNDTWMYRFDYAPISAKLNGLGATHAVEVSVALNNTKGEGIAYSFWRDTPEDIIKKFIENMHMSWVNFAKTGDPNGNLDIEWKKYDSKSRTTFVFDEENKVENNPAKDIYETWRDIKLYTDI